jgi:hypothetical protein
VSAPVVPDVYLDEHTREELQPPCEAGFAVNFGPFVVSFKPCEDTAKWAARIRCGCGASTICLLCDQHARVVAHMMCLTCGRVGTLVTLSLVPVRGTEVLR